MSRRNPLREIIFYTLFFIVLSMTLNFLLSTLIIILIMAVSNDSLFAQLESAANGNELLAVIEAYLNS